MPSSPASFTQWKVWVTVAVVLCIILGPIAVALISDVSSQTNPRKRVTKCTTINKAGTYVITDNIGESTSASGNCITIEASHVTLNGAGHTLHARGVSDSTGILVSRSSPITDVTIHSVKETNWNRGIQIRNASKVTIQDVNVSQDAEGIAMWNTTNSSITNSTFDRNFFGIVLDRDAHDVRIDSNTYKGNYISTVERGHGHLKNRSARTAPT